MPDDLDNIVNSFMVQIKKIEDNLNNDLEKLAYRMRDMTDTELIRTTKQLNFLQELVDKGYGTEINNLMVASLQQLKDLDTEALLNRGKLHGDKLKTLLFKNIYSNNSIAETVRQLRETELATYQLNVAVGTGLRQFDDLSRYTVFKGLDVKWTYVGPQDNRTRPACQSTHSNEPSGGYTEDQVNSDTSTPFGVRGGFNCRHQWMVA